MRDLAVPIAQRLLAAAPGNLEELWIRQFTDDIEAHDDCLQSQLVHDFQSAFDMVTEDLTREFGRPSLVGIDECDIIPACGVFRFSLWKIDSRQLYLFAAHQDRELPFLRMLGTTELA